MNFDEFKIIAKGLRSVYTSPNFLPDGDSVKVWFQLLKDLEYDQLNAAVMSWCTTQKFPPTIADLRSTCASFINDSEEEEWSKGWELTMQAVQRYGFYQGEKGINSLPVIEKEVAERIGWTNICNMDITNMNVNRAQYRDIYNAVLARKKKEDMLPAFVKDRISVLRKNIGIDVNSRKEITG